MDTYCGFVLVKTDEKVLEKKEKQFAKEIRKNVEDIFDDKYFDDDELFENQYGGITESSRDFPDGLLEGKAILLDGEFCYCCDEGIEPVVEKVFKNEKVDVTYYFEGLDNYWCRRYEKGKWTDVPMHMKIVYGE